MSEVLEFSESVGSNAAVNSHFGLIVDIAVALIFLLFAVWHARKGFYKTFAGIIAVVVAIAIGIIGAGYLTPPVMEKAWPKVKRRSWKTMTPAWATLLRNCTTWWAAARKSC